MGTIKYCQICGAKLYFGACLRLTLHVQIEDQQRKGGRPGSGRKKKPKKNGQEKN